MDEFGQPIGIMDRDEAIAQARAQEKDIVLIAEKAVPPVAKMISFSKFKYQLDQKKAEGKKASKKQELKEIRLRPFMGAGDLEARIRRIREFLEDGDKVRPYVEFKGREITKKEFGDRLLGQIIEQTADLGVVEIPAKLMGKKMFLQLMPSKKKKIEHKPNPSESEEKEPNDKV